jgi:HEAT repeat protein
MTWPRRFTDVVGRSKRLATDVAVLWALGSVDSQASTAILMRALDRRAGGSQYARWAALESLVRLRSSVLPDVLGAALADRASNVRFTAVTASAEFGDGRHLDALRRLAARDSEGEGARAAARASIAAITRRGGR